MQLYVGENRFASSPSLMNNIAKTLSYPPTTYIFYVIGSKFLTLKTNHNETEVCGAEWCAISTSKDVWLTLLLLSVILTKNSEAEGGLKQRRVFTTRLNIS